MLINNDTSGLKEEMKFDENLEIQKRNDNEIMIRNVLQNQIWLLEDESSESEKLFLKINDVLFPDQIGSTNNVNGTNGSNSNRGSGNLSFDEK